MINNLFGILVIVNMNVINHAILVSIMKIVNTEKKLIDKLVDECTETVEEVKPAIITLAENENKNSYKCNSCIMYTVLFRLFFTTNIGRIGAYFAGI